MPTDAVIECVKGDITRQRDVDVVVNAANEWLAPGSGVAGAIHEAAGPGLFAECEPIGPISPGQAVITGAHRMPNRWIVHCLGPVFGRDEPADELLASCYREAVRLADAKGVRSIAFPAISTGAFRFPVARGARVALAATREALDAAENIELARFVLYDEPTLRIFETAMAESGGA